MALESAGYRTDNGLTTIAAVNLTHICIYIGGYSTERVLYPVPSLRSTGWKPKTPCFAARRHPARPPASHARGDERAG